MSPSLRRPWANRSPQIDRLADGMFSNFGPWPLSSKALSRYCVYVAFVVLRDMLGFLLAEATFGGC